MGNPRLSRKWSRLFIIVLLAISLIAPSIPFVRADWLDSDWLYRKSHTITGSSAGAQTDYQRGIKAYYGAGTDGTEAVYGITFGKVYLDSKCQTDFDDINFTKADGTTSLDYWMEIKVDSSYALFWVEVDSIPEDPSTVDIYIYYGNAGATTLSSGINTFVDFDDFEDDDFSNWFMYQTVTSSSDQAYTGSKSAKQIGAGQTAALLEKTGLDYTDHSIRLAIFSGNGVNDEGVILWCDDNSNVAQMGGVSDDFRDDNLIYRKDSGGSTDSGIAQGSNLWHQIEMRVEGGTTAWILIDGTLMFNNGNIDTEVDKIWAGNLWSAADSTTYWDTFMIRKYVNPEPTHTSWGSEEEPTPVNVITNIMIVASDSTVDDEQWFFLNSSIEILENASTFLFNRIDLDPTGLNLSCSYTNATDTFVEESDPNNYLELDVVISVKTDINSTDVRIDYYLRLHPNVTKDGLYNVTVYSTASGDLNDTDLFTDVFTLTIRVPSAPTLLYGAGFNSSSPYVELHWTNNLELVTFFEVQNSSNDADWTYLGTNTTAWYTDSTVSNGTERYYKVRACRDTGAGWKNSSFTGSNFETVYFVQAAGNGNGDTYVTGSIGIFLMAFIILLPIIIYAVKKK